MLLRLRRYSHFSAKRQLLIAFPRSIFARRCYQQRKGIKVEVTCETVTGVAQPTILRNIGELLALLGACIFDAKQIVKVMNHFMNKNRDLDIGAAGPAHRQINSLDEVVVERYGAQLRVGFTPSRDAQIRERSFLYTSI